MTDDSRGLAATENEQSSERTVRLSIPEMDCPSWAGKVGESLQHVDGGVETDRQPTTGTATITYDSSRTSRADVVAAVQGAGSEVVNDEPASDADADDVAVAPPSDTWTSEEAIETWIGAAFVTLGLLVVFVFTGQNLALASAFDNPLRVADGLFLAAVAASGVPVVRSGYYSARNRSLDIDLLVGTAITGTQ